MYTLRFIIFAFVLPLLSILIPLIIFLYRKLKYKLVIALYRRTIFLFVITWSLLSFLLFVLLLFLSQGINIYFRLEKGIFVNEQTIIWNMTSTLQITFIFDPGFGLLAVSILSGLLYSALLILPKVCTQTLHVKNLNVAPGTASASVSSMASSASAFASTAVCCSTSSIAVIAPSLSVFLGPYVPFLLVLSYLLLIYSFNSVVMTRFPKGFSYEKLNLS